MGLVVGLTGGIGSGKSTVANLFAERGISVVDADEIAREVVSPGSSALAEISQHFGPDILTQSGELDRSALRQRIFADPWEKQWLESLLHPLIRQTILQRVAASTAIYTLLVAPLLLETGLDQHTNKVLVVDVPESVQIARTVTRDNNHPSQVEKIIATQIDREQRLAKADFVVDNTGGPEHLAEQVARLDQAFRQLAASAD